MQELDKEAMGRRIRQIRLGASLRQWELAKLLGTTQSAVHKYEHGVVPEPRRLVELARIGGTSVEWVLTGTHWENGSEGQERVSPDLMRTACLLREIGDAGPGAVDDALRILRDALAALTRRPDDERTEPAHAAAEIRSHGPGILELLRDAHRIQLAVLRRIRRDTSQRLESSPLSAEDDAALDDQTPRPGAARRSRS
jgi:transcriptional regulator with XRE-family HTH domain